MNIGHYEGMLNPGFCAVLVAAMTEAAGTERPDSARLGSPGLHWLFPYLLIPLALHQRSAEQIKSSKRKSLWDLVTDHPEILVGLERRMANGAPFVRRGIAVALLRNAIQADNEHLSFITLEHSVSMQRRRLEEILVPEDRVCVQAAARLGRWTAHASVSQVCTILQVHPRWTRPGNLTANSPSNGTS